MLKYSNNPDQLKRYFETHLTASNTVAVTRVLSQCTIFKNCCFVNVSAFGSYFKGIIIENPFALPREKYISQISNLFKLIDEHTRVHEEHYIYDWTETTTLV